MQLPTQIINEILEKARADRPQNQQPREVPSPRGVANFQFDDLDDGVPAGAAARTVRLFAKGQSAESATNRLCCQFLDAAMSRTLTMTEYSRCMTIKSSHVTMALNMFMTHDEAMECNDDFNADEMDADDDDLNADDIDTDDTSDCDDESDDESDGESDDESSFNDNSNTTFDDAYPPVPNMGISDGRFKDEVLLPLMHDLMWDVGLSTNIAGMLKQALYSYVVAKLSDYYNEIFGQVEEASSLLELVLWKAKIDESAAETEGEKQQCRVNSRADIVVRNVLPYLFAGVSDEN